MKDPKTGKSDPPQGIHKYPYLLAKIAFFALLAFLVIWILTAVQSVLFTLFISLLIAYILDPLVDFFERFHLPRTGIILGMVVAVLLAVVGFSFWVIPPLIEEFYQLATGIGAWFAQDHTALFAQIESYTGLSSEKDLAPLKAKLEEAAPDILSHVGLFLEGAAAKTLSAVSSILNIVMVPLFVFYFLRDFDKMTGWVTEQIPHKHRQFVVERAERANGVVGDWLRGQVEVALILAALYAFGLWLVEIKLGIAIGLLAGLLNIVPYLGFAFGLFLALLMAFLDWHGWGPVVGVGVVFSVAQVLEGYVLTPKIVGEKVGLPPVVVLIALLLGGEAFGLLGIVVAVPIAGVLKTFGAEAISWYQTTDYYLEGGGNSPVDVAEAPPPTTAAPEG